MSKRRSRGSRWRLLRPALAGLVCALAAGALGGCDDRLPGFADPPPYDAGDHDLDAASDEDAG